MSLAFCSCSDGHPVYVKTDVSPLGISTARTTLDNQQMNFKTINMV